MPNARYDLSDTIVAIGSPSRGQRAVVRISGSETFAICKRLFSPSTMVAGSGVASGTVAVDAGLSVDARLYMFPAPHSYTGDDVAEIHVYTNAAAVQTIVDNLLAMGLRAASPGEFTARAYLNGKVDLAQAEAVNEIISSSNLYQLAAAQKLLSGQLSKTGAQVRSEIMECLGLIEAGLDFSGEQIEFIHQNEAVERLGRIKGRLEQLLTGSVSYESVVDLPAVGIAGAPNAGKSSLLNRLLGKDRSIISQHRKTTRDVLCGPLTLARSTCALFDCAGLALETDDILDHLAQQAAVEALRNSSMVLFCVDASKTDWAEDMSIRKLVDARVLIPVATKCDTLSGRALMGRLASLCRLFAAEFVPTSARVGTGVQLLRRRIDSELLKISPRLAAPHAQEMSFSETPQDWIALTARHRQAVTEAIANLGQCVTQMQAGNDEVAAFLLRAAYQTLCDIEQQPVDEQILKFIFRNFCVGK